MMRATSSKGSFVGCALAILTIATPLQAQTAAAGAADSRWHFAIAPYFWGPTSRDGRSLSTSPRWRGPLPTPARTR